MTERNFYKSPLSLAQAALLALFLASGTAWAETVYLYDNGPGKYAKSLNEITIWKEAAIPQRSNSRLPRAGDIRNVKCFAKGRSSASVVARSGNAVEVKVSGGCRGFVNKQFTHDSK
jgi:hypothetical protein